MARIIDTGRAIAHAWMCDHMGHMNTRFYAAIVDDAGFQMLEEVAPHAELRPTGRGWADVSFTMALKREAGVGTVIHVGSQLTRLGTKSITHQHHLVSPDRAVTYATAEIVTVLFNLEARAAMPLDEALRARCHTLLED